MSDTAFAAAEAAPASEPSSQPAETGAPSSSAREALDRAFAKAGLDDAQPPRPVQSQTEPEPAKPEAKAKAAEPAKPEAKAADKPKPEAPIKVETNRAPDGKFAAKEPAAEAQPEAKPAPRPSSFPDAPSRFSNDAKAAWAEAPEAVRAEVHRATKELEQGIAKYKDDAEAYAEVKEFADLAKRSGTTLKQAMSNFVGIEQKLRQDFLGGLEILCQNRGTSLRQIAAQIMGQKPDEVAANQDKTVAALRNEIAQLRQQMGGVTKSIEQQRSEAVMSQVEAFMAEPGHERFEELASDIKFFLESGRTSDLAEAYALAERLNPAPAPSQPAQPATPPPAADPAAQPRKGALAVHGAPSSGSDPATRKPPSSATDAVDRAFAQLGLG